jgi:hypothetical protein
VARIEKHQETEQEIAGMKHEVFDAVSKSNRKPHPRLACCGMLMVFFVVGIGVCAWLAAATGLVRVPLVSSLAYERPVPVTEVRAGVPVETTIVTQLSASALSDTDTIDIVLSEESLTASFRTMVEEAGVSFVRTEDVQVAVVEGRGLELFFPLRNNEQETAVRAILQIGTGSNRLSATVIDVRFGTLPLPSWLIAASVDALVSGVLTRMNESVPAGASITSVSYERHAVRIILQRSPLGL